MDAKSLFGEWAPKRMEDDLVGEQSMPSDPSDPHRWKIGITWEPGFNEGSGVVNVRWTCKACESDFAISLARPRPPVPGDQAALERAIRLKLRRAKIHPRCSELRTVKEVMGS